MATLYKINITHFSLNSNLIKDIICCLTIWWRIFIHPSLSPHQKKQQQKTILPYIYRRKKTQLH